MSGVVNKIAHINKYKPENISKTPRNTYIHTLKMGRGVRRFFVFMELEPFFNYFVIIKTLNTSNEKCIKSVVCSEFIQKIYKRVYGAMVYLLYNLVWWGCYNSSYLLIQSHSSTIFLSIRHQILVMRSIN